tara:strand:+ start:1043 stop:2251 length:1209 start_codon:yes stop_codon:yes gene_type:complete
MYLNSASSGTSGCSIYNIVNNKTKSQVVALSRESKNKNKSLVQLASNICCPPPNYNWYGVFANNNSSATATTTPQTFFATSENGLYKGIFSTDGVPKLELLSLSLELLSLSLTLSSYLPTTTIASNADATIVVVGVPNVGVYISTDSGDTWIKKVPTESSTIIVASNSDGSVLIAAISNGYGSTQSDLYYSTDSGDTWTDKVISDVFIVSLAIDATDNVVLGYNNNSTGTSAVYSWTVGADTQTQILMDPPTYAIPYVSIVSISSDSTIITIITVTTNNSFYVGNAEDGLTVNNPPFDGETISMTYASTNNTGSNIVVMGIFNSAILYPGTYDSAKNNYTFNDSYTTNTPSSYQSGNYPMASDNYGNIYTASGQNLIQLQLDADTNTYTQSSAVTWGNITGI